MNSRQDLEEAAKLASSLLDRTRDGKIEWTVLDEDQFVYSTPRGIDFVVSGSDNGLGFRMQDQGGHNLISVVTESGREYWEMAEGEAGLAEALTPLYDLARRSALKVDEKVSEISKYLESL
mgnify:CR=1 FL=1